MAKPNWPHWAIPGEMLYWTGPNGARYWTLEQAICLSLDIDPNETFPEHERKRYAERLRELQDAIGWEKSPLMVKDGRVELSDFVFWAHQRPGWEDMPAELFTIAVDEPIPQKSEPSLISSDGVTAQDLADMVEFANNDEEAIDWDFWIGKMPRWTAHQAVRLMAALDPAKHPDLSFKRNEAAGSAKEQAKRLETLAGSHDITEASPSDWLKWADELREPVHDGLRFALANLNQFAASNANAGTTAAIGRAETIDGAKVVNSVANAPRLMIGRNDRTVVIGWIADQAGRLKKDGDTLATLAARIHKEIPCGAESERGDISVESIKRLIPTGLTGGRAKNGK